MNSRKKIESAARRMKVSIIQLRHSIQRDYDYGGPVGEWELYGKIDCLSDKSKVAHSALNDFKWRDGFSALGETPEDLIYDMEQSVKYYNEL